MNYERRQTERKLWSLWRDQGIRSFCGDFGSRAEAEKAIIQLKKLFPNSIYTIEFEGGYQTVEGDPTGNSQ